MEHQTMLECQTQAVHWVRMGVVLLKKQIQTAPRVVCLEGFQDSRCLQEAAARCRLPSRVGCRLRPQEPVLGYKLVDPRRGLYISYIRKCLIYMITRILYVHMLALRIFCQEMELFFLETNGRKVNK